MAAEFRLIRRTPSVLLATGILAGALGCILAVPATRAVALRSAGAVLVQEDPLQPVEIIVIAIDANDAGVLEAVDLVNAGIATRVAVLSEAPDEIDQEFDRRGVPRESTADRSIRHLKAFGVSKVATVPLNVTGSEDEGEVVSRWCATEHIATAVLVTTRDHSRRLRRIMRRAAEQSPIDIHVRASRYSTFDPQKWWQTRRGLRVGIVELEKLFLDLVRHPLP